MLYRGDIRGVVFVVTVNGLFAALGEAVARHGEGDPVPGAGTGVGLQKRRVAQQPVAAHGVRPAGLKGGNDQRVQIRRAALGPRCGQKRKKKQNCA